MSADRADRLAAIVDLAAEARRHFPYGGFHDLDNAQIQILITIAAIETSSPAEVASRLRLDRSSVSKPLASLEASGLVVVREDTKDGRRRQLEMTRSGSELVDSYLNYLDRSLK